MSSQMNTESTPVETELEIKSVLLVDDDVDLANALKALMEAHNFIVTVVCNGVDALKEVMELDFDAIICDLMMPKMPGDMFYLAVQKTKPQLCRRFVFITGHSGDPKVESFLRATQALSLHKPFQPQDLVRMIAHVLARVKEDTAKY